MGHFPKYRNTPVWNLCGVGDHPKSVISLILMKVHHGKHTNVVVKTVAPVPMPTAGIHLRNNYLFKIYMYIAFSQVLLSGYFNLVLP